MEPQRVEAGSTVGWLGDGWRSFTGSPGMWVLFTLVWALVLFAFQLIPLIGPLVFQLIAPSLAGGWLLAARNASAGEPVEVSCLFQPLVQEHSRRPMLMLGLLLLVVDLLAVLVAGGVMAAGGMPHGAGAGGGEMGMGPNAPVAMALSVVLSLVLLALFYFAIPLVLFAGAAPTSAIGASVRAALANWAPLLLLAAIALALGLVASVPLLLGWLVLLPVLAAAWHRSFQDIFPAPDDSDPASAII